MALRVILIIPLAAFLFFGIVRGDNPPNLPSRKANVVMPLLEQFSPKGNSRLATMNQLGEILGEADTGEILSHGSTEYGNFHFKLDDGTHVDVSFVDDKLMSITAHLPNQKPDQSDKVIYSK